MVEMSQLTDWCPIREERPTGRLAWHAGVLHQEWEVVTRTFGNASTSPNTVRRTEWRPVPELPPEENVSDAP